MAQNRGKDKPDSGLDRRDEGQSGSWAHTPHSPPPHAIKINAWGDPRCYSCFLDEGLNKVAASIGRCAHRSVWEQRVFHFFRATEGARHKRARCVGK